MFVSRSKITSVFRARPYRNLGKNNPDYGFLLPASRLQRIEHCPEDGHLPDALCRRGRTARDFLSETEYRAQPSTALGTDSAIGFRPVGKQADKKIILLNKNVYHLIMEQKPPKRENRQSLRLPNANFSKRDSTERAPRQSPRPQA